MRTTDKLLQLPWYGNVPLDVYSSQDNRFHHQQTVLNRHVAYFRVTLCLCLKRVLAQTLHIKMRFPDLYENDPVGGRHFRMNGSKARFDTEAKRNSEMAYYQ